MKEKSAIEFFIGMKVEHHVKSVKGSTISEVRLVKFIAAGEGYAMVRRHGCMPYICSTTDLRPVGQSSVDTTP